MDHLPCFSAHSSAQAFRSFESETTKFVFFVFSDCLINSVDCSAALIVFILCRPATSCLLVVRTPALVTGGEADGDDQRVRGDLHRSSQADPERAGGKNHHGNGGEETNNITNSTLPHNLNLSTNTGTNRYNRAFAW